MEDYLAEPNGQKDADEFGPDSHLKVETHTRENQTVVTMFDLESATRQILRPMFRKT